MWEISEGKLFRRRRVLIFAILILLVTGIILISIGFILLNVEGKLMDVIFNRLTVYFIYLPVGSLCLGSVLICVLYLLAKTGGGE